LAFVTAAQYIAFRIADILIFETSHPEFFIAQADLHRLEGLRQVGPKPLRHAAAGNDWKDRRQLFARTTPGAFPDGANVAPKVICGMGHRGVGCEWWVGTLSFRS
jgi:hypothetical protein